MYPLAFVHNVLHLRWQVINCVSANQECVKDIAASEVLGYLLLALQLLPSARVLTLETLAALMSSTKIVKEAMTKGQWKLWSKVSGQKKLWSKVNGSYGQ